MISHLQAQVFIDQVAARIDAILQPQARFDFVGKQIVRKVVQARQRCRRFQVVAAETKMCEA